MGGSFFPKLDLFFYKCHFIYRYIQDEMLENVSYIKKKNWVCGLCPYFLLCKYSSMKRIVTENMDYQKFFFFFFNGVGALFDPPLSTGLHLLLIFQNLHEKTFHTEKRNPLILCVTFLEMGKIKISVKYRKFIWKIMKNKSVIKTTKFIRIR